MEVPAPPRGLIIDLITPFRRNGSIDETGLQRVLERVSPYAQAFLLAGPRGGEGKSLASEQREELLERAVHTVRGRLPILMWVTQETEQKTRENILQLRKVLEKRNYGAPVYWVDTPLYYHSNRGLPSLYRGFCSMVDKSFILHNDPEMISALPKPLKRRNIRTAIFKELSHMQSITGIIFLGSLQRSHHYQRASRDRPGFRMYDGDEESFLMHPSLSGILSVGGNLAPKAWQTITLSSLQLTSEQKNYPDRIQQIWETGEYLRSLKQIYRNRSVALIKAVLSHMGIIETSTCTDEGADVEIPKRALLECMTRYGDCLDSPPTHNGG